MNPAEALQKMGPTKFKEMVMKGQKGKTMHDRQRGVRGRVKYRQCQHAVWIVDNYVDKVCDKCLEEMGGFEKGREFQPHFNVGLGCWIESKSEMMKVAKKNNMIHIGTDRI